MTSKHSLPHHIILRDKSLTYDKKIYANIQKLERSGTLEKSNEMSLLIDSKSFHYALDTLPDIPFLDRLRLIKSRLERHVSGSQFKGLLKYGSKKVGYCGLSQNPFIQESLQALKEWKLPIQNISLFPLELIKLAPKEFKWSLSVYQNEEGETRHLLIQNQHLVFTRVIESSIRFIEDIESTLKYAERFNLDVSKGCIAQVGLLSTPLPDEIMGLNVQKIEPENSIETVVLNSLKKSAKPALKLTPNPFLKNYLTFKSPSWFKKFSLGYGGVALGLSALLYFNGIMESKRYDVLQDKLENVKVNLHHFEKTHKGLIEKVAFIKAYEQVIAEDEDPLAHLRKIAVLKPASLILSKIEWEKHPSQKGELRVVAVNLAHGLTPKVHRKTYKRFHKSLTQSLPLQSVERVKHGIISTPTKLLIAQNDKQAKTYTPLPETYSIRGMTS